MCIRDRHKDGLLPFIIKRPIQFQKHIEEEGQRIRFAVSRGPLNIASFLMGSTDFLIALKTQPKEIDLFLKRITNFIMEWLWFQKETFPSICLLYTSPSPRDRTRSRMPSSA